MYSYYKLTFDLMQHHKYSLRDLEQMIPWELEIYVRMIEEWQLKEKQKENQ